jgi:ubiquinone/menaquinone biosynthesis C-methylase UbiE
MFDASSTPSSNATHGAAATRTAASSSESQFRLRRLMREPASYRRAYRLQQAALLAACVGIQRLVRTMVANGTPPDPATLAAVQRRFQALLERDLENAERGLYPWSSLFQIPLREYARRLPRLAAEVPRMLWRSRRGAFDELPRGEDLSRYPGYFLRTFHWQTDGYLSQRSAELYDLSVEFLFLGAADVMRRQVMAPLADAANQPGGRLRILDVACGSGAMLRQLAHAWPRHDYYGIDLSPHYVRTARERLRHVQSISLIPANAEDLPFRDGFFDALVSVYLFHELPKDARRNVAREMFRVLRPGGALVIQDSAQLSESAEIASLLERFTRELHEPYYPGYIRDDLSEFLSEAGFQIERVEPCYVAKVVVARKSPPPACGG